MLFDRLDNELQREANLPHPYYEILVRLSEAPERTLRMSDLAHRALASRSRLSHAAARLEERGWIRRQVCKDDRRGQLAILTDAGFAALEGAAPIHVEGVRRHLLDVLTAEQVRELGRISGAVRDHLKADPEPS